MIPVVARPAALPVAVAAAVCPRLARARTPASTTRPPAPTAGGLPPSRSSPAKTARSIAVTASRHIAPPAPADVATRAVAATAAAVAATAAAGAVVDVILAAVVATHAAAAVIAGNRN